MMKYHIRSLAIILSLVMIFSVASVGCRSNDDSSTTSTVSSKTERKKKIIVIKKKRESSASSSTSSSSDSQNTVDNNQQGNNNPNNNQTVTEKIPVAVNKTFAPLTSGGDLLLLENPDRGFRTEIVWDVTEAMQASDMDKYFDDKFSIYVNSYQEPCKLALAYVYLTKYNRSASIPAEGIAAIEKFFEKCKAKKIKLMLRFCYCTSFLKLDENADERTIIRHIKQLAPVVKKYSPVIHTISCGFVGSFGEWAYAYQQPSVNYKTVMSNIVKYLSAPNKLYFSIRMPKYKNLFDKTDPIYKMISYNNDAMFGEQSNSGWESEGYQLGSAEWTQVMNEGAYTPQDGEMFTNQNMIETNRKPSGLQVILETAHHRHTSMSSWHGYYEASANSTSVMHAWKREVITPELLEKNHIVYAPSWFKDNNGKSVTRNAFEFIRDHLGYKVEAQKLSVAGESKAGSKINISMSLKNYGMSVGFNLVSGFAILDDEYRVVSHVKAGDPTSWYSHSPDSITDTNVPEYSISAQMNLPNKSGHYYLAFYLKNTLNDMARLSNQIEVCDGFNLIHEFTI